MMVLLAAAALGAPAARAAEPPLKLVALGDSLTAGYRLPADAAFPAVLERALKAKGRAVEIANAGVSGDTTTGGLDRLDWSVPDGTDGVILELGANDMLRGTDPAVARKALETIVARLKERGIPVCSPECWPRRISAPTTAPGSTRSIPISPRRTASSSTPSSSKA